MRQTQTKAHAIDVRQAFPTNLRRDGRCRSAG